jgi:Domain of unknown function (DUF4157)
LPAQFRLALAWLLARALYERALQQAHGAAPGRVQEVYLALLADARREASRPSSGKITRTMRLEAERAGQKRRNTRVSQLTGQPIAPGHVTLTSYLARPARDPRVRDRSPEIDGERTHLEAMNAALQRPSMSTRHVADEFERTLDALLGTGTSQGAWAGAERAEEAWTEEVLWADEEAEHTPEPLPQALRARMERAFGQSFDHVRLHRDSPVPAGWQAFTRGGDIYLGPDTVAPDSLDGERILAHELAHVAQQARPTIFRERRPTIAALEADAHQASLQALAGQAAAVHLTAPAGLTLGYGDDPDASDGSSSQHDGWSAGEHGANTDADQPSASQDDETVYYEYQVLVPESYSTLEQMYRLFERTVYGREMHFEWECGGRCDMSRNRGTTVRFLIPRQLVDAETDPEVERQREQSRQDYQALPLGMRRAIQAEVDRRYYELSGDAPGTRIAPGEVGRARMWEQTLAEVMAKRKPWSSSRRRSVS